MSTTPTEIVHSSLGLYIGADRDRDAFWIAIPWFLGDPCTLHVDRKAKQDRRAPTGSAV